MKTFAEISFAFLQETVLLNPYIPHTPEPKQAFFLALTQIEALYGGAAGGGKSDALLMAALQFVHVPGYAALLLRKTFRDLNQPGSLIPRSFAWLAGRPDCRWDAANKQWMFNCPGGGTSVIKFGYLDNANDIYQYQSSEFQFVGFDELTQFRQFDYRYLFSRLRKPSACDLHENAPVAWRSGVPCCEACGKAAPLLATIPLRMRAGSNPGGIGHEWVKRRFMVEKSDKRVFVPAKLADNPHLNRSAYLQSLSHLDPLTRAQLENGDWSARSSGAMFNRQWFKKVLPRQPASLRDIVRFWDLAASEPDDYDDPDWTSGGKVGFLDGQWFICHLLRFQKSPFDNEKTIRATAHVDGEHVRIAMEQEPGASGKSIIDHYARNVVPGYSFRGRPALKDKVSRAAPFSSAAEAGNVILIEGDWIEGFLDEVECFPNVTHDDRVDCVTGAMAELTEFASGAAPTEVDLEALLAGGSDKYATGHQKRDAGLGV